MIVAIEGIDAAGKNSQVAALHSYFTKHHSTRLASVRKHDFPHYETTAGEVVGRILRGETLVVPTDAIELLEAQPFRDIITTSKRLASRDKAIIVQSVMIADRLEWMPLLVEYAQSHDNLLLLDRYKMSGVAYGAAEGVEANWTRMVQSCIPDADLNVLLDISVEESIHRRPERRDHNEKDLGKLYRARGYYLREFAQADDLDPESNIVIDGSKSSGEITLSIVSAIVRKMSLLRRDSEVNFQHKSS